MERTPSVGVSTGALIADLRAAIGGEVRFDAGSRALYSTDSSNYRQVPIGVVVPRDVDDIVATVEICRRHGVPILNRGAGTSLAGQTCNRAVVIDSSKYLNRVLEIDPQRGLARVQPGVVLDDLREAAERYHLTFAPDPSTHNRCTLGGMIGNNSCGVHSVMAGKTDANVEEMEILTYDGIRLRVGATSETEMENMIASGGRPGEIYAGLRDLRNSCAPLIRERFPRIPRRVSGYNLDQLLPENGFHVARALVGSEGTCVTVLEATVRLVHSPPARTVLVLGYPDIYAAAEHVPAVLGYGPVGLEGFDRTLIEDMQKKQLHPDGIALLPPGDGWLVVEFGGETPVDAEEAAQRLMGDLSRNPDLRLRLFPDPAQQRKIWEVRESGLAAAAVVPGEPPTWPGWEDAAVLPERLGEYLRDFKALAARYGYRAALYGHFGEGCIHTRQNFDFGTPEGIKAFRSFIDEAADLVIRYGGSLSGEHGDGQARAELYPKMFGDELVRAFGVFKGLWDPENRMNPGKLVEPRRLDENLRLGPEYRPRPVRTHFRFPDDGGDFRQSTLRCVGVGKCRRHEAGTMCPSYMVTREEMHSTRGRARLLFEMLQGNPLDGGWRNQSVKEALDLCLACKGCKGECPVAVDMATYKAEFLSHYYAGRLRPLTAYTLGLIPWWARLAARMPGAVNAAGQVPGLRDVVKRAAGIAPERRLPTFAAQTFRDWFNRRGKAVTGRPRVLLWPDTFNNHFHPGTARAAVEVLETAGFQVDIPRQILCCGRPLYDYGWLDQARGLLVQILDALEPDLDAGVPVIGLEPSCMAVFRDELTNLLPDDPRAERLKAQSYLLSEFLEAQGWEPPRLERRAVVHGHCHHKAVMKMTAETAVLQKMGLDLRILDAGCCGMAGAFGFEREHYDVSIACGERMLLPAVRAADAETLILADGFSCREQIAQTTNRRTLHLAEVLQMALRQGPDGPAEGLPEREYAEVGARLNRTSGGIAAGVLLAFATIGWYARKHR